MRDPDVRQELKIRNGARIDEGITNLTRALELDPNYDDAMAYMNLLLRLGAELRDTNEEYARDIASADSWVQKALEIKRQKGGIGFTATSGAPPPARCAADSRGPVEVMTQADVNFTLAQQ